MNIDSRGAFFVIPGTGKRLSSLWKMARGDRDDNMKERKRERTAATIHVLLALSSLEISYHFSSLRLVRIVYRVLRLPLIVGGFMELGLGRGIVVFRCSRLGWKWDREVALGERVG